VARCVRSDTVRGIERPCVGFDSMPLTGCRSGISGTGQEAHPGGQYLSRTSDLRGSAEIIMSREVHGAVTCDGGEESIYVQASNKHMV
jgi:hypothetical protein